MKRPRIQKQSINSRIYDKLREIHSNTKTVNSKYKMLMLNVEMKTACLT